MVLNQSMQISQKKLHSFGKMVNAIPSGRSSSVCFARFLYILKMALPCKSGRTVHGTSYKHLPEYALCSSYTPYPQVRTLGYQRPTGSHFSLHDAQFK